MKIGAAINASKITEETFIKFKKANIEYIEVSCSYEEDFENLDFQKLKKLSEKYEVGLWSFHLSFFPFETFDISSLNEQTREYSIQVFSKQIRRAASIGIDKFIIHPSAEPYSDEEREVHIKLAAESLKKLSELAVSLGGVLCVENLPRTCLSRCSDDMLKLISLDENLRVCFDTNHLLIEDAKAFIEKLSSKIVTIHVSDYDFINERHWLPGEGKQDFYTIYKALIENGYQGIWNYEVTPFVSETETIRRTKVLEMEDFYQNAMEIFSNAPLTVYGTPTL